jgi:hypothetical protein
MRHRSIVAIACARLKSVLIQTFVAEFPVEALNERVFHGLARPMNCSWTPAV